MASKQVSPAAQLLRRSRLFSLPPSLPRPGREQRAASTLYESDTATLPHPIYASIETTEASRSRGDWGLKRPLPLKSTTKTTTPVVRVKEVDNIDHITNFESAADHSLTLEKWQEMNMSLNETSHSPVQFYGVISTGSSGRRNVFDAFANRSTPSNDPGQRELRRWKFKGPWLGGMNNIEFDNYVKREIKNRRPEFRQYLRNWILDKKREETRAEATAAGKIEEFDESQVSLSEEEFQTWTIRLRHQGGALNEIIWQFLDLAGDGTKGVHTKDHGPPATHPSAGLSYLRTHNQLHNHPVFGPQGEAPPIRARVLKRELSNYESREPTSVGNRKSSMGIGGIVSEVRGVPKHRTGEANIESFESHGGERLFVAPTNASIDSEGKIVLQANGASSTAKAVWDHEVPVLSEKAKKEADHISDMMGERKGRLNFSNEQLLKNIRTHADRGI